MADAVNTYVSNDGGVTWVPQSASSLTLPSGATPLANSITAAGTLLTVPIGKTFIGEVALNAAIVNTPGAGSGAGCLATLTLAGTGVAPAAGSIVLQVNPVAPASAAAGIGTVGTESNRISVVIIAGSAAATVVLATTATTTSASAAGYYL